MNKTIYFDMDGTIANLYDVKDWLPKLEQEDPTPYSEAKPLVDMKKLNTLCKQLIEKGYQIGIISWLAKNSTKGYTQQVRQAKRDWIKQYFPNVQEVHIIKYGTNKRRIGKTGDILFDDELRNNIQWESNKQDRESILCRKFHEQIIFGKLRELLQTA